MKKEISEYCSKAQAERYLLNKMSPDEETLFQMHLESCRDCRKYVDSIRNLSYLLSDETPVFMGTFSKKNPETKKRIRLWSYVSIAACILMIIGVSHSIFKYRNGGFGNSTHITHIDYQSKADKADMKLKMVSPKKEIMLLYPGIPIVFKWNMVTYYKLVVLQADQTLVETIGFGDSYIMSLFTKIEDSTDLNWILVAEDNELKGTIYVNNIFNKKNEKKGF